MATADLARLADVRDVLLDAVEALRTSNVVAVVMLFAVGASYGRCVHLSPGVVGVAMVLLGTALVALTIAFGG